MRLRFSGGMKCERAHVVQAVGELDQQHPHVVRDGEQELAEVLALRRPLGDEVEPLDLGQAVDERADLGAEDLVDLLERRLGVLDSVVQHGGRDGGVVELEVGEDGGDFEGMAEEQDRRRPASGAVRHHGIDIGAVEKRLVGRRDCSA